MIRIKSPHAKRIFASHIMAEHPEMLEFIAEVGRVFGPLKEIGYSGDDEDELRAKLLANRDAPPQL